MHHQAAVLCVFVAIWYCSGILLQENMVFNKTYAPMLGAGQKHLPLSTAIETDALFLLFLQFSLSF